MTDIPARTAEPQQHVIDARTTSPGPLAKKYPGEAEAYRTVKQRAEHDGTWGFAGFAEFLTALGPQPSPDHSVDRPDRTGAYAPGNVRWASPQEQANNRSTNKHVTINGEALTYAEAGRRFNVSPNAIKKRKARGWSDHKSVFGVEAPTTAPTVAPAPRDGYAKITPPAGWQAKIMPNGQLAPYVLRIDFDASDPYSFPLDHWFWSDEAVRDHCEKIFQHSCRPGYTRADHACRNLNLAADRIAAVTDRWIAQQEDRLSNMERSILAVAEDGTGEIIWAHPTFSPEECNARYEKRLADINEARSRRQTLLAPYELLLAEFRRREDEDCLPKFWRATAKGAGRSKPSSDWGDD